MKRVLITGANKGIGLATAQAVLEHDEEAFVIVGARNSTRGLAAIDTLCHHQPDWASRIDLLALDVADPESVLSARDTLAGRYEPEAAPLYGLVNNAGVGLGSDDLETVLGVNTLGVKRVCDAFIPLLAEAGRIVNVSSASAPKFVSQCSPGCQDFFQDSTLEWAALERLIKDAIAFQGDAERIAGLGLGDLNAYGFSKACLSLYTLILARENPQLRINACTPGYIETDLTRPRAAMSGVSPADMGMKPPVDGTVSALFLLFGSPQGSGHYYGSDAKRSPLNRYRSPGSPEYTGD